MAMKFPPVPPFLITDNVNFSGPVRKMVLTCWLTFGVNSFASSTSKSPAFRSGLGEHQGPGGNLARQVRLTGIGGLPSRQKSWILGLEL
jgi:hypothetical protein